MFGLGLETSIALIFIIILIIYFHVKYNDKTVVYAPTILTTTGIFATFLGIAFGLLHFDTTNIEASVPALLNGLKTAFWASVMGVGGALTLKFRHFFIGEKADETGLPQDVTPKDILIALKEINITLEQQQGSQEFVSQIKLLRQDNNDRLDALKQAQIEALNKLNEMSSKTLVEALRDVIYDFNNKITEQFGDNFKELNEAVGRLLIWQEDYKGFVEQTTAQYRQVVISMEQASKDYKTLVDQAGNFTQTSQQLGEMLTALDLQKNNLQQMLTSLAELLLKASGSLPDIENKIIELTKQLTSSVQANQERVSHTITEFDNHSKELIEKTSRQSQEFNVGIEKAVNDSLTSLGKQLAIMTEKFAHDYEGLAESLEKISRMTKGTL
ncbi:hypothetical protein [Acinetobacter baumannii]|uniref:hypothetical protein n=1 Tax=Acinetobacter baumannii TaxID=470 RepID=UPI0034A43F3E